MEVLNYTFEHIMTMCIWKTMMPASKQFLPPWQRRLAKEVMFLVALVCLSVDNITHNVKNGLE